MVRVLREHTRPGIRVASAVADARSAALQTIAALYVDPNGVYANLPGVEVWDEARDARLYAGPWPVVAHPPCARWSRLAGFTEARFGLKRGDDGGCFEAALHAVRLYGGVLEHPAYSAAFARYELPRPITHHGWTLAFDGGASCYVEQGRYGLPVKKATWLYAFGVDLPDLRWGYKPDSEGEQPNGVFGGIDAWRDKFKGRRDMWTASLDKPRGPDGVRRRASHLGLTSTTPPAFRDVLLAMARSAVVEDTSQATDSEDESCGIRPSGGRQT